MYKIYIDGELAYYPGDELLILTGCELHLALNDSGTFEFDISPDSAFYDRIASRVTMVQVVKDDKELFYGEVRDISRDLYNVKHVYCVGELAFLFDSIQPQAVYHDLSPRQMLETWMNWHNSMTEEKKHFQVGIVTIHDNNDSIYRFTNEEPTLEAIREKLLDKLGGYLKIRKVNGIRYLDWLTLADYGKICEQPIKFGMNLLDYSEDTTADDLYTAVIPHGVRLDESPVEGLEAYLDITSVNDGKNYLYIPEAVERYGWIMAVQQWEDVGIPANLKEKGEQWLHDNQYETMTLELNAVDLSVLSQRFDSFELGDQVHALAAPYGMDRYFPVQKLDIYLQEPNKNLLLLGEITKKGYAEHSSNTDKKVDEKIDDVKVTTSWLQSAIENVTQMMTGSKGGYKVSEYDEDGRWLRDLYMDAPTKEAAQHVMQINMSGIAFSRDGYDGPYKNAWTIDGVFLGEFVKANSIQGESLSTEYKQTVEKQIDNAETGAKEYAQSYTTAAVQAMEGRINLGVTEKLSYALHDYCLNGDFSDELNNWLVSDAAYITIYNHSTLGKCVRFRNGSSSPYLRQSYDMDAGKYTVRFKAAIEAGAEGSVRVKCIFDGSSQYTEVGALKIDEWSQFEFEYDVVQKGKKNLDLYNTSSAIPVLISDVEVLGSYEVYNEAQIKVISNEIAMKVSENDLDSIFEQRADSIRMRAAKISWTATYSSMTEDGVLTCTGAKIGGTVTVGGSNNKNGQIKVLDANGAIKNTVDKDGFTSNATNGSHQLKGILNGSCLKFYIDNALSLDLEPVYDNSDTGYTAFCTYKPLYFVPGAGGSVAYRYGGSRGSGSYHAPHYFGSSVYMAGSLTVAGTKNRCALTEDYDDRLLYCYEMASPYFGDIGSGVIGDDGLCFVTMDDVFCETVNTGINYQVFLQKEGPGDLYVAQKTQGYFVVAGTPGLPFVWEAKAKQRGYESERLEVNEKAPDDALGIDYESEAAQMVEEYYQELEEAYA